MSKEIIVTNDKKFIKKLIFDGTEDDAIKICKVIKEYGIYEGFAGFGRYLTHARGGKPKIEKEIMDNLIKVLNGQKEETHHVWIVLQAVMLWMAGQAPQEFKDKVNEDESRS